MVDRSRDVAQGSIHNTTHTQCFLYLVNSQFRMTTTQNPGIIYRLFTDQQLSLRVLLFLLAAPINSIVPSILLRDSYLILFS